MFINLAERRLLSDYIINLAIKLLVAKNGNKRYSTKEFLTKIAAYDPVIEAKKANEQHYEVPAEFFTYFLGKRLKYSCGYWGEHLEFINQSADFLDQSEEIMLEKSCKSAELSDGMSILELGCGWGSLTLWLAEKYPNSQITTVSNSLSQKEYIDSQLKTKGFKNVTVITCNVVDLELDRKFDRVISVEMFEHVYNWEFLLSKVSKLLTSEGKLFLHFFSSVNGPFCYENNNYSDWMARNFFSGGIMPSDDLLLHLKHSFYVEKLEKINGMHYSTTAKAWLENLSNNENKILLLFNKLYGKKQASIKLQKWRMFLMACQNFFAYKNGSIYGVSHALLKVIN